MIKKASSKRWMQEHVTDHFVKQAQKDGYRSRAAYKLLEIAQKDRLLTPGSIVFDLGAAPGGWSQVVAKAVGANGRVFAVDLLAVQPVHGVQMFRGDFTEAEMRQTLLNLAPQGADLVLSDMAPNISGIADRDQRLSFELAELAVEFAADALKPGGHVLLKVFQSEWVDELRGRMSELFSRVLVRKPEASRGRSAEVFLLGQGRLHPSDKTSCTASAEST
ncbi:MAG: RlmE family RNA methyltransferase [Betaproteobacteria bacterium]|nr:RlmE family RNA methyltransferase [Betaproteobacteria bacterium]NCU94703.1 RlmE family RNA methyltransferase [Betaproteobacteria bacterium]